jgi:hypothetical protein
MIKKDGMVVKKSKDGSGSIQILLIKELYHKKVEFASLT